LTHGEMMTLLKNKVITLDLFDERTIPISSENFSQEPSVTTR
jgi:hypothetical protein